ncbi:MAG TPA: type III PLP-dependent enzyme [Terriglobales bacterium]|nr:type III PLP-dependent enzyme [Terriglobales bacterium]
MTHVPEFISSRWDQSNGELLVGSIPISSIAERHGTPVFVYDDRILEEQLSGLRDVLPPRFSIYYSVKANPNPAFLTFFLGRGCGLEVASAGELQQALAAGCAPTNILFAGPGKTLAELVFAIAEGIGEIHAESELEIHRILEISRAQRKRTAISVRVNPSEEGSGGAMRMGGKSAPFGVDEESLVPILRDISEDQNLEFCGIHLFAGTQILDYRVLLAQYRKGLQIAKQAADVTGSPIRTLDFGGGLGIPYFPGDRELDRTHLKAGLSDLMVSVEDDACFAPSKFVLEPGRYLVGESGLYVARVNDIKVSRGKKFVILDGGMNHHLSASGNLGQVIKRNFPIAILNKFASAAIETVDVVGPLCTPLDTLGRSVQLPAAEVGDLVGIFQSGAYARAASPLGFLSHPSPPEVLVHHEQDLLIRRRGTFEDVIQDLRNLSPQLQAVS